MSLPTTQHDLFYEEILGNFFPGATAPRGAINPLAAPNQETIEGCKNVLNTCNSSKTMKNKCYTNADIVRDYLIPCECIRCTQHSQERFRRHERIRADRRAAPHRIQGGEPYIGRPQPAPYRLTGAGGAAHDDDSEAQSEKIARQTLWARMARREAADAAPEPGPLDRHMAANQAEWNANVARAIPGGGGAASTGGGGAAAAALAAAHADDEGINPLGLGQQPSTRKTRRSRATDGGRRRRRQRRRRRKKTRRPRIGHNKKKRKSRRRQRSRRRR